MQEQQGGRPRHELAFSLLVVVCKESCKKNFGVNSFILTNLGVAPLGLKVASSNSISVYIKPWGIIRAFPCFPYRHAKCVFFFPGPYQSLYHHLLKQGPHNLS